MCYGDTINSSTGELISENRLCASAKYSESYFLWIDDEHWGLIDDVFGTYFFALTK